MSELQEALVHASLIALILVEVVVAVLVVAR